MSEDQVRIVIQLPADLHREAAAAAAKDERSLAALVRFLLKQYVNEGQPKDA